MTKAAGPKADEVKKAKGGCSIRCPVCSKDLAFPCVSTAPRYFVGHLGSCTGEEIEADSSDLEVSPSPINWRRLEPGSRVKINLHGVLWKATIRGRAKRLGGFEVHYNRRGTSMVDWVRLRQVVKIIDDETEDGSADGLGKSPTDTKAGEAKKSLRQKNQAKNDCSIRCPVCSKEFFYPNVSTAVRRFEEHVERCNGEKIEADSSDCEVWHVLRDPCEPGSRVAIDEYGVLWKATVQERCGRKGKRGFFVHFDGKDSAVRDWVPIGAVKKLVPRNVEGRRSDGPRKPSTKPAERVAAEERVAYDSELRDDVAEVAVAKASLTPDKFQLQHGSGKMVSAPKAFVLSGTLELHFKPPGLKLRRHCIRGDWWEKKSPQETQSFEWSCMIPPGEGPTDVPRDGEFEGSYFDDEPVPESVRLAFEPKVRSDEIFSVNGKGKNGFGTFNVVGTAKKDASDLSYVPKRCPRGRFQSQRCTTRYKLVLEKWYLDSPVSPLKAGTVVDYEGEKSRNGKRKKRVSSGDNEGNSLRKTARVGTNKNHVTGGEKATLSGEASSGTTMSSPLSLPRPQMAPADIYSLSTDDEAGMSPEKGRGRDETMAKEGNEETFANDAVSAGLQSFHFTDNKAGKSPEKGRGRDETTAKESNEETFTNDAAGATTRGSPPRSRASNSVSVDRADSEDPDAENCYFVLVVSGKVTTHMIEVSRMRVVSFGRLREEIERDVILPFASFRFTLYAGAPTRVGPKQEENGEKWNVWKYELTKQGDGGLRNPYHVFIEPHCDEQA